ncbi:NAD(P)-dependent oxidoreductase [Modestobacter sp. Leaf380]|uniref:NAD(P)-dependent oxidoreductase n=1 Tax=Modestobacter sp. Leaf380 TaxID=1736356 RepID=UPI0006FE0313|nr:NAD(P)-dependent oxidoreductase [Modestobacter sp. Leaf380]KQS64251.1 2-hydroxy-3-oxopropionate reductase [Modestobacter sp. Leaf380]
MDTIGFIGTGAMGASIASRLVAGHELLVNDRNPIATQELVRAGARFAEPAEIADRARLVFLCLPGPDQVEDLLFGTTALAGALAPGTIVIDTTTGTPGRDESVVAQLGARSVTYVDAPIAGGVRRAREGTATLMVGATPEVFARVEPVLREVTAGAVNVGPVGTGHAMKLVNNLLNACNRFAALEAVRLGVAAGMAQDVVVDLLNRGSGRNYATEYTYPQLLSGDAYLPQGFTVELMLKDVRLALELADTLDHETPVGDLAQRLTQQAVQRFGGGADQSQMMAEWYRP